MASETKLSIIIRTVDQATAGLKKITEPIEKLKKSLDGFGKAAGLDGLKKLGESVKDMTIKFVGLATAATYAFTRLIGQFDELGDAAERIGVPVDALAQLRYAAEQSGASVQDLDAGLGTFSKSLGEARAGTGRMLGFLQKVSPALAKQVKGAKSNEEAFDLMAAAMAKITDPAKRAALATKVFGDAALGPLLARGPKGIKELRDRYLQLAGSQQAAADAAGPVDAAMHDLNAAMDGVKGTIVTALAPAFKEVVEKLTTWIAKNREWLGQKISEAMKVIAAVAGKLFDALSFVVGVVSDVVKWFSDLGPVAQGVAIGIGIVGAALWALSANPVILVAAALVGLIEVVRRVVKAIGSMRDFWDSTIIEMAEGAIQVMKWNPIGGAALAAPMEAVLTKFKGSVKARHAAENPGMGVSGMMGAAGSVPFLGTQERPNLLGGVENRLGRAAGAAKGQLEVVFKNAPAGMRVTETKPGGTDLDVGVVYDHLLFGAFGRAR